MTKEFNFKVGERISHDKFGEGVVQRVAFSSNGKDVHVDIEFDEAMKSTPNSPSTRYRKILSSYLQNLGMPEALEVEVPNPDLLLPDGMEIILPLDDTNEDYVPSEEEKEEASGSESDTELNFS